MHVGFRYRGAKDYNRIPANIRAARTLPTFKMKLRPGYFEITVPVLTNLIAARDRGLKIKIIKY